MSIKAYVGIDQGVTGAVAVLRHDSCQASQMPVIKTGKKNLVDVLALSELLRLAGDVSAVYVERTQIQPKFGAKGNHGSGVSAGRVNAVIEIMRLPWREVQPKEWQRAIGIATATDKKLAVLHWVRQRFPGIGAEGWKRGDGRADALALAWYCMQQEGCKHGA